MKKLQTEIFTRQTVLSHLEQASAVALKLARDLIQQRLSDSLRYVLDLSHGLGNNIFIQDQGNKGSFGPSSDEPGTIEQAIDWLWFDGRVAMWVDINVRTTDQKHTYIALLRSPKFILPSAKLYHIEEGYPPFHVRSPNIPPGWESIQQNGRFNLEWWKESSK